MRSVQVHDSAVTRAEAGQRVAVALPGVERSELRRGAALVTPGCVSRLRTGSTSRWRSSPRSRRACTSITAPPRCRRVSSGSASGGRSCGCRRRSSRRAATTSSSAPERRSAAGPCSIRRRRATRAPSGWSSSSAARSARRCTRPCGPSRCVASAAPTASSTPATGCSRRRGWTSCARSWSAGSHARIRSIPAFRRPPIPGRRRSCRCSGWSGAARSSTCPARRPSSARAPTRPPRSRRSSGSTR